MVVVVNIGRDGGIVVGPLLVGDNAVAVAVAEGGEELNEDLFVSHLSADDLGVLAAVVDDTQVGGGDGTVTIGIELSETLVDDFLSGLIGGASDSVKELVVTDDTILVKVKMIKENASLALRDGSSEVLQSPVELLFVDFTITVVINDTERTAHATDGAYAAGGEGCLHLLENLLHEKGVISGLMTVLTYFR